MSRYLAEVAALGLQERGEVSASANEATNDRLTRSHWNAKLFAHLIVARYNLSEICRRAVPRGNDPDFLELRVSPVVPPTQVKLLQHAPLPLTSTRRLILRSLLELLQCDLPVSP